MTATAEAAAAAIANDPIGQNREEEAQTGGNCLCLLFPHEDQEEYQVTGTVLSGLEYDRNCGIHADVHTKQKSCDIISVFGSLAQHTAAPIKWTHFSAFSD